MSLHFTHICSCIYCYSGVYSYCTHWSILWRDKCVPNTGAQQYPERWCIHRQCRYICCNIESYAVRHTKKKYLHISSDHTEHTSIAFCDLKFFFVFFFGGNLIGTMCVSFYWITNHSYSCTYVQYELVYCIHVTMNKKKSKCIPIPRKFSI